MASRSMTVKSSSSRGDSQEQGRRGEAGTGIEDVRTDEKASSRGIGTKRGIAFNDFLTLNEVKRGIETPGSDDVATMHVASLPEKRQQKSSSRSREG